jgi:hypothetical protein
MLMTDLVSDLQVNNKFENVLALIDTNSFFTMNIYNYVSPAPKQ